MELTEPRFTAAEIFDHEACNHANAEEHPDCPACIFHRAYLMGRQSAFKQMTDALRREVDEIRERYS